MANQARLKSIQCSGKVRTKMDFPRSRPLLAFVVLAGLAGCTEQKQSSQDLKERTAEATAQAKSDAKAVAEGIREGWNRDSNKPLDLNRATKDQLMRLPEVTSAQADRVIAGRPYNDPGELVTRHIMPGSEYDKIADRVTARR